jgi:hypothetical protein
MSYTIGGGGNPQPHGPDSPVPEPPDPPPPEIAAQV